MEATKRVLSLLQDSRKGVESGQVNGKGSVTMRLEPSGSIRQFIRHWFRRETVSRAVKVACVVGPLLTLINQHDVLLSRQLSPRLFVKILLTFLVPYSVSSFSSARAYMEEENKAKGGTLCQI